MAASCFAVGGGPRCLWVSQRIGWSRLLLAALVVFHFASPARLPLPATGRAAVPVAFAPQAMASMAAACGRPATGPLPVKRSKRGAQLSGLRARRGRLNPWRIGASVASFVVAAPSGSVWAYTRQAPPRGVGGRGLRATAKPSPRPSPTRKSAPKAKPGGRQTAKPRRPPGVKKPARAVAKAKTNAPAAERRPPSEMRASFDPETLKNFDLFQDVQHVTKQELLTRPRELPHGYIDPVKWELFKLFGRLGDPGYPLTCQSARPQLLVDRFFKGLKQRLFITQNEFKLAVDHRMPFLVPGFGELFHNFGLTCLRAWMEARGLRAGPEVLPPCRSIFGPRRPAGEVSLAFAVRGCNKEINRQGVHPAALHCLWQFFADTPLEEFENDDVPPPNPPATGGGLVAVRSRVLQKLQAMITPDDAAAGEGVTPDSFCRVLEEPVREALARFRLTEYLAYHRDVTAERAKRDQTLHDNAGKLLSS
eukprot:GHVT01021117.1.p1 GENE.GHVT01021117.1~~GHVT01021117.1.p1  ORF type:complete len:478 (+),score=93.54 GHVT01021117.1:336-1769(+)